MKKLSAVSFFAAGALFAAFMFFHPANSVAGARETVWVPVHLAWLLAYALILAGLPGLFVALSEQGSHAAKYIVGLLFAGIVMSIPVASYDSFITPYLALHSPSMIKDIEEDSMDLPALAFRIFFFLHVAIFSLSAVVLGIYSLRTDLIPWPAGILIAVGAPVFWVGALVLSGRAALGNAVTIFGAVSYGLGWMWLGWPLLRTKMPIAAKT